ncbi:MAG TPA: hypothetical protein VMS17_29495 [Gemmataceae bacterium]|nr:hypothetical protein [Gemmataceae bacterium]
MSAILATTAGDVDWQHGSPWMIDAAQDDVLMMLGQPHRVRRYGNKLTQFWYRRVDWIGGVQVRVVEFYDGIAYNDIATYDCFSVMPPWLAAIRDAILPQPAP